MRFRTTTSGISTVGCHYKFPILNPPTNLENLYRWLFSATTTGHSRVGIRSLQRRGCPGYLLPVRNLRTRRPRRGGSTLSGAQQSSNNTGELTAIAEALTWLRDEAPGPDNTPAEILYDSHYAANLVLGHTTPHANHTLANNAQSL